MGEGVTGGTGVRTAQDFESAAVEIDRNLQARHWPHHTVLDPVFSAPDSDEIVGYTRGGDSAIWTGHYLAAEAYRYNATDDDEALSNIRRALEGLRLLAEITGTGLLARVVLPKDSPYLNYITGEESRHGVHYAQDYVWIGHTSRDQYCGVFFGLACAFDLVHDDSVRAAAAALATRLLDFLVQHHWNVVMPDGEISTVFIGRADQQLALLQIGRRLNPGRFDAEYRKRRLALAPLVMVPIAYEVLDDHHSYFKLNLDTINLFSLIHFEEGVRLKAKYMAAYKVLRRTTDNHANAHFNMIDRILNGPNEARDRETRDLLAAWLRRPRRDPYVDLRGQFPSSGQPDKAAVAIPVQQRVRTDFLWQRSPFLLYGGGEGKIETAGIDFLLPYWMGRHCGILSSLDYT